MTKLCFTTTGAWDLADGFGCASLGLAGVCDNSENRVVTKEIPAESRVLTGSYQTLLSDVKAVTEQQNVYAGIVLFGNAGGENVFMEKLCKLLNCPLVGGGAAIDGATGRKGLITGGGEAAVLLFTDGNYHYSAETLCIHSNVLQICDVTTADPRTVLTVDGVDAVTFLNEKRAELGLKNTDFEHLTLSDTDDVNAHLSCPDGQIKSGRDVKARMKLRYIPHEKVYNTMRDFYDDEDAIVFGCAGLSGLLDKPLDTKSLGLFLFGEVCTVGNRAEFGNLMLSKLKISKK
ncbi:MAG: hypothetical protein E7421_05440 [Ruminococcaceae bacterium]|nr:hypothetical protein [Oscillospiraceae bacterium]